MASFVLWQTDMKYRWISVAIILLISGSIRSDATTLKSESAYEIAEAYQMNGVSEAVSGMISEGVSSYLDGEVKRWTVDVFSSHKYSEVKYNKEEIKKRLKTALKELYFWSKYDYVVINKNLSQTVDSVEKIIESERLKSTRFDYAGWGKGKRIVEKSLWQD